jgi:hypothetical protein
MQTEEMRRVSVTPHDLAQAIREQMNHTDPAKIRLAYLERDGGISIIAEKTGTARYQRIRGGRRADRSRRALTKRTGGGWIDRILRGRQSKLPGIEVQPWDSLRSV